MPNRLRILIITVLALFFSTGKVSAGVSVAPLGGVNPVYGVFFGGAVFFQNEKETRKYGLVSVLTLKDSYQFKPEALWELEGRWRIEWRNEVSLGFDPYFGEGISTSNTQTNLFGKKVLSRLETRYSLDEDVSIAPWIGFTGRKDDGIDQDPGRRAFPDEGSISIGFTQAIERKDVDENPLHGWHEFLSLWVIPQQTFTSDFQTGTVGQGEFRLGLMRQVFPMWVIASQLMVNKTFFGHPSYLHRFRLGGTDRLRGYYENRFRGEDSLLLQTELRFPIYWLFSGVIFADQGSVSENFRFAKFRSTVGGGLRVALPPDRVQRARLDFGVGHDQKGVFVDFGHTF